MKYFHQAHLHTAIYRADFTLASVLKVQFAMLGNILD